jgi:exodeoxyribonuclease VII large subunit
MALGAVVVAGEVTHSRRPASGHCYFTLKDADAQVRAVMWRSQTAAVPFVPGDGMLVRVEGYVSVYEARGDLQVIAQEMQLAGEGALQKAFEALKRKLAAEGLFDAAHKQPLPPYPEAIGLVTSGTGAALHDMVSVLRRRFPQVRVLLCAVQVQGMGAAEAIAEAIEAFNEVPEGDPLRVDLLLVGRGGGSVEDLWAFNEEIVARAIHASRLPVISAVGHETDISIADFVADCRAATPSMGAELAVPDRRDVEAAVRGLHAALHESLTRKLLLHRQRISYLTGCYAFNRPVDRVRQYGQHLDGLTGRLHRSARQHLRGEQVRLEALRRQLEMLDPMRPLGRGYAWVERGGQPVRSAHELAAGDAVTLNFRDGRKEADIKK